MTYSHENESANIAFLLGIPRSGTTLLSLLLNQHPDIYCPPEPWLLLALESIGQTLPSHSADASLLYKAAGDFLGPERNEMLADMARAAYRRKLSATGKTLLVDKSPRYYQCLDRIGAAFPEAPLVWLIRNPLDVAASYWTSWGVDLAAIIQARADSPFFADYVLGLRRLLEFSERRDMCIVRYESLLAGLNPEMARITRHLGVSEFVFSEAVSPADSGFSGETFGDRKILANPHLHTQSIGTYHKILSPAQIGILLSALGAETWNRLGYAAEYQVALETLGDTPEDRSDECHAAAQDWLAQRQARCLSAHGETQSIQSLETENRRLREQIRGLESQALGSIAKGLPGFFKRHARKLIEAAIRRVAGQNRKPPLPRITLVTPVFNGAEYLEETIRSVLSQEYPGLEYIIVDGGSTDGTLDIIAKYQTCPEFPQRIARLVSEPDEGMYDALAKGFAVAGGEIFGYLNADDVLEAGSLREIGFYFAEHPKASVIYHENIVRVDGWKFPNAEQPHGISSADLLNRHILFQDGVFFRRQAYEAVGGIRRDLRLAGDFDLWLRLSRRFRFTYRPGHVSGFRIRPRQLSADMAAYREEMQRVLRAFEATLPAWRRAYWKILGKIRNCLWRQRRRWFRSWRHFPMDFAVSPQYSDCLPAMSAHPPRSPIDRARADRLLFSCLAAGLERQEIHCYHLDSRNRIAICPSAPAIPDLAEVSGQGASEENIRNFTPYRHYSIAPYWHRILFHLPIEYLAPVARGFRRSEDRATPAAHTLMRILKLLRPAGVSGSDALRVLDVGCGAGELLDEIQGNTAWQTFGLESNLQSAKTASGQGHTVWRCAPEDALQHVPENVRFDLIHMGHSLGDCPDPLRIVRILRMLLAPGGALVIGSPNLDSVQIDWFGLSWTHWQPIHRHIFSVQGMRALAMQAGLRVDACHTCSRADWTALSLQRLGLSGVMARDFLYGRAILQRARRLTLWSRLLWDWRGRGDATYMVLRDNDA